MRFKVTHKKTGESVEFGFQDLYGYEGEVSGVILGVKPTWVLVYNKDSYLEHHSNEVCKEGGVNPDLQISLVHE